MNKFDKFYLFDGHKYYFILATMQSKWANKIYQLDRQKDSIDIYTHPKVYNYQQAMNKVGLLLMSTKHQKKENKRSEQFKQEMMELVKERLVCKFYGIIGFVQFIKYNYMILITGREVQSRIVDNVIYKITNTRKIVIQNKELQGQLDFNQQNLEDQYIELFDLFSFENGTFFFSYDIDISRSHQKQLQSNEQLYMSQYYKQQQQQQEQQQNSQKLQEDNRFVWNHKLLKCLYEQVNDQELILKVVNGSVLQLNIHCSKEYLLQYLIISRRQRFNQGPRYIARGIDSHSNPANEVESEHILFKIDRQMIVQYVQSYLVVIIGCMMFRHEVRFL